MKWVLVIPHYVVLAFLWSGYAVVAVIAFFAILFTEPGSTAPILDRR